VDISDSRSQHINAQICDHLTFVGICTLAHPYYAVFLAADGADLSLQGHALFTADTDQLFGLLHVLLDGIVGAVEHNGRKSGFDAL